MILKVGHGCQTKSNRGALVAKHAASANAAVSSLCMLSERQAPCSMRTLKSMRVPRLANSQWVVLRLAAWLPG